MGRKTCLVLYKDEWNRLKKQAGSQKKPVKHENEYLKASVEKSQKWIKSWPDTVQGHVAQVKRQQEKQHAKDIAIIKSYASKKKKDSTDEAIKKARQLIFEDSCYGKQLISALNESKTLEERDVQVLFQRDLKQKATAERKQSIKNDYCSFDLDKLQSKNHIASLKAALDTAQYNKEIFKINRDNVSKECEKEKQNRLEKERMIEQLRINETREKEKYSIVQRQTLTEFEAEKRQQKDQRAKRDELADIAAERYRKHQEMMKYKIQQVFKEIYKNRQDTVLSKNNYELIQNIQEDEKKRYDEFVQKGINDCKDRISKKEQEDALIQKMKQSSNKQSQKVSADALKVCNATRLFCDRQTILPKCHKNPPRGGERGKPDNDGEKSKQQFLVPRNNLVENLKKREKEPTAWNGSKAAHAQFAAQADEILGQCVYKNKARKVVDDYMKQNCLDTLPLANY